MSEDPRFNHQHIRPVKLSSIGSFEELRREGFTPFALGPVYVYAEVGWSLPNQFASEEQKGRPEVHGTTMHFDRTVVARCKECNNIIDIMDTPSFQWFKRWMIAQQFCNRQRKQFTVTRHYVVPILDPITLDTQMLARPTTLDIFTVSGMRGSLVPVTGVTDFSRTPCYVDFMNMPPDEDVQVLGSAALKIVRDS